MHHKNCSKIWLYTFWIAITFLLCFVISVMLDNAVFSKYFSPIQITYNPPPELPHESYYWDVEHYANHVLENRCNAFYPLWALIIRLLFNPQTIDRTAYAMRMVAASIFFITLPGFIWVFTKIFKQAKTTLIISLLFYLSPLAIFRVIGYTEAIFSVWTVIFIFLILSYLKTPHFLKLFGVLLVVFLMSLTRLILIQFTAASLSILATLIFKDLYCSNNINSFLLSAKKYSQEIKLSFAIAIASFMGYAVYGNFCLMTRGDFFAPFHDQSLFGKKLGFHPELLLFPKSPLVDLWGLYYPFILLGLALLIVALTVGKKSLKVWLPQSLFWNLLLIYPPAWVLLAASQNIFTARNRRILLVSQENFSSLINNYVFWFSLYFCVANSLIYFFIETRLYSLGRYVFGVPFFFVALGYLYDSIASGKLDRLLWGAIGISAILLIQQWVIYGQNGWLG